MRRKVVCHAFCADVSMATPLMRRRWVISTDVSRLKRSMCSSSTHTPMSSTGPKPLPVGCMAVWPSPCTRMASSASSSQLVDGGSAGGMGTGAPRQSATSRHTRQGRAPSTGLFAAAAQQTQRDTVRQHATQSARWTQRTGGEARRAPMRMSARSTLGKSSKLRRVRCQDRGACVGARTSLAAPHRPRTAHRGQQHAHRRRRQGAPR